MNDRQTPNPSGASSFVRTLAKGAGYTSVRLSPLERGIHFLGRTREWNIVAFCRGDWLGLYTMVVSVPEQPGIRARLFEATMLANETMPLSKFSVNGERLFLEMQYRVEHVNSDVFGKAVGLMFEHAEQYYPRIFRIVAGDDVLERLEESR